MLSLSSAAIPSFFVLSFAAGRFFARSFTDDIDELIPYFEKVFYKFVKLQVKRRES